MKINSINSFVTPKTTGYAAAAGIGLSMLSGASKNKFLRRVHTPVAFLTVLITVLHIGQIEYYHYKFRGK